MPLADAAERILRVRIDELYSFVPRALAPAAGLSRPPGARPRRAPATVGPGRPRRIPAARRADRTGRRTARCGGAAKRRYHQPYTRARRGGVADATREDPMSTPEITR